MGLTASAPSQFTFNSKDEEWTVTLKLFPSDDEWDERITLVGVGGASKAHLHHLHIGQKDGRWTLIRGHGYGGGEPSNEDVMWFALELLRHDISEVAEKLLEFALDGER